MQEDQYTIKTEFVNVGDGHSLYVQQWGNPKADPIFFLHGGPGSGCSDKHKLSFDPRKHHVIFHDQRGCGKSLPLRELTNNTTQHLIADIEMIRIAFGFRKINIFGGSWGSCLGLAYAVTYPDKVNKMLLSAVYTGTKSETDYIQQGGLATHFPETWQQYINLVPENQRHDTVSYYFEKMQDTDSEVANEHIRRWIINESTATTIDPDIGLSVLNASQVDDHARSLAIVEAHYFMNDCFLPTNFILDNAHKLKEIQLVMVHGRYDHICPPQTVYELAQAIGDTCRLHIVPGSHRRELALRETIKAYVWALFY